MSVLVKYQRNRASDVDASESFTYDRLHRLTRSVLGAGGTSTTNNYAYDGVGPIVASALYQHIGNGSEFKNGRAVSASVGFVPRQHSSGGKHNLLGINKVRRWLPSHLIDTCYQQCKTDPLPQLKSDPVVSQWYLFKGRHDFKRRTHENTDFASTRAFTKSDS